MATKNKGTVKSLTKQLSSVAKQAKSLGIDTRKAESMIRQTKAEGGKAYKGSTYESEYNELVKPIPVADIKNQKPVDLPTPPVPADLTGMLTGNNAGLGAGADGMFDTTKTPESSDPYADIFKFTMDSLTSAQKELGNSEDRYAKLEKKNDLPELRRDVNNYQSQLNSIVAEANANKLKLEGQGRGIPDVVIGGQQAQIEREAAIRALPVQAQLAAAQGNLEIAQAHVDRLFTLQTEDAKNRYNFKVQAIQAVSNYANEAQNRKLEELRRKEDRAWELQKINMSDLRTLANTAIEYGQSSLAGQIMRLDPTSPTFANDYANLQAKVSRPVTPKAPDLQNFGTTDNPMWRQYDPATGQWVEVSGLPTPSGTTDELAQAGSIQKVRQIESVLSNRAINTAVGTSLLTRGKGGVGSLLKSLTVVGAPSGLNAIYNRLSGDQQNFIAGVKQITDQLTLDKLVQSKQEDATFGALSDSERITLASAASKLGTWEVEDSKGNVVGYNTDQTSFQKEMDIINNFAKLDAVLKGVSPEQVGVQVQPDGSLWAMNSDGTMTRLR